MLENYSRAAPGPQHTPFPCILSCETSAFPPHRPGKPLCPVTCPQRRGRGIVSLNRLDNHTAALLNWNPTGCTCPDVQTAQESPQTQRLLAGILLPSPHSRLPGVGKRPHTLQGSGLCGTAGRACNGRSSAELLRMHLENEGGHQPPSTSLSNADTHGKLRTPHLPNEP